MRIISKLENQGWHILGHNQKILGTQIDIVARDPQGGLVLLEVKSARVLEFGGISKRQKQRLKNVALSLSEREPLRLLLAIEDSKVSGGVFLTEILDDSGLT